MVEDPNTPWDFWAAIGTFASALGAFVAAAVAWYQISALRRQQKGWESLKVCERYDSDPIISDALKTMRDARDSGRLKDNPKPLRLEITTIMNYLEGVATGIAQGFYDERVVRDHLEPMVKFHTDEVLEPSMVSKLGIDPDDFSRVKDLRDSWNKSPKPNYKMSWW